MEDRVSIHAVRLQHWMNARKLTLPMLADLAEVPPGVLDQVIGGLQSDVSYAVARQLAGALHVELGRLSAGDELPTFIYQSRAELESTRRPLQRDGIHFYNYYSLPSFKGHVGPVILDILCPAGRIPALNNGHLEPAITLNLGPGDIFGRWGEQSNASNWALLAANHRSERWVVGASYTEPSYCPHSYSLASPEPAQILSYTCRSNLTQLIAETDRWSLKASGTLIEAVGRHPRGAFVLELAMQRRGFEPAALAAATTISESAIRSYLDGDGRALPDAALRTIASKLGIDYRTCLEPAHDHDEVGKSVLTVDEAVRSTRCFRSYTAASIAASSLLPDLVGMFMRVDKPHASAAESRDLLDYGVTHYLVTGGELCFHIEEVDGGTTVLPLAAHDSLVVAPFIAHGFSGAGSLIKLGSGEGCSYLDLMELTNTFRASDTLRRARRNPNNWGYDVVVEAQS
jgi:hypothetical protein